jgi:DNA-binding NarL/FixJ family response regulator
MTDTKPEVQLNKRHILLVDDQKLILSMLKRILSLHLSDCRTDIDLNGDEAVDAFREGHHGVLILDINMPGKDGYTTFLDIQKLCMAENSEMPAVVFYSAKEMPKEIRHIIETTPRHCFLRKTVTHTELLNALKARIES